MLVFLFSLLKTKGKKTSQKQSKHKHKILKITSIFIHIRMIFLKHIYIYTKEYIKAYSKILNKRIKLCLTAIYR
jgi:membrane-anchored protein YejM (alkaline phosphatase superfamily)